MGEDNKNMAGKNKKIDNLINTTAENFQQFINVDSVIGKPIYTISGFQIIPFSKVVTANLSGGGEYGQLKVIREIDEIPFAGGAGGIVSLKPMGFLIDDGKSCQLIRVSEEPLDNLIEHATEIIRNVTSNKESPKEKRNESP